VKGGVKMNNGTIAIASLDDAEVSRIKCNC
jgi:hypothetical protein